MVSSDLDLFGALIDRAGFRARLVYEHSIFIESFIIYELEAARAASGNAVRYDEGRRALRGSSCSRM
jgi:hypothetical protein